MIDPKAFLALSEAEKNAHLASLPEDQRIAFVQSVQAYEATRGAVTPTLPLAGTPRPNVANDIAGIPATRNTSITQPLAPQSDRSDPDAEIAAIQPNQQIDPQLPQSKQPLQQLMDRLSTVGTVATTMIDMANMANPAQTEVAPSAISSGVAGAIAGAKAGPIGAIGGGLLGMVSGGLKAGTQREAYEQQEYEKQLRKFTGLRMAPRTYEEGGIPPTEADPALPIPVQEEKGEVMFFPDGKLVDSMAKKTHKQMDNDDVTDFIPDGTVIFSNSEKKVIDLSKFKDHVLNITKGHYSEDGNTPGETILFGDVYGKKGKKTPAVLAKAVRKMTPIIEKPVEQIEIDTNAENLRRRAELLLPIMQIQEGVYKKFEFEKPMKFEKGGIARKKRKKSVIPKYEGGTDGCGVGYIKDESGNCVPDIQTLAGMNETQLDSVLASVPRDQYEGIYEMVRNYNNTTKDGNSPIPVPPIPGLSITNPITAPAARKNPLAAMTIDPKININIPSTPTIGTDAYAKVDESLAANREQVNQDYDASLAADEDLYRGQRFRNIGILAQRLTGVGMQDKTETPVTLGTEHVNNMYPQIQESQIQSQLTPIRKQQSRVLGAINESGLSGSKIGSAIASTQDRLIEAESDVRSKAGIFNQTQEGKRYERLKNIIDLNRASEVGAENKTRENQNRMVANVANIGANALKDEGGLQEALANKREELKRWKQQNMRQLDQAQFDNILRREEQKIKREWQDKIRTDLASIVSKYIVPHGNV